MKTRTSDQFHWVPAALGLVLWSISGSLTVALFWGFAESSVVAEVIAVLWALALESTKIWCWRQGKSYRLLSLGLVCLTLFSAWGLSVSTVATQQAKAETFVTEQASVQRQIDVLVVRLEQLPPDYVTGAAQLNRELASLREIQKANDDTMPDSAAQSPGRSTDPFLSLESMTGWPRENWVVLVAFLIALLTEGSALALVSTKTASETMPALAPEESGPAALTAADYLRVATDHPMAPRLLGRLEVAKRLGIGENQSRLLLSELLKSGRIKRSGKAFEVKR